MKVATEEFISNFHDLDGTTIGEKRKSLFLLLNKTQQSDFADLDFSSLQPRTSLEEKFKVEVLIYIKRIPELIEILKCENLILVKTVLKSGSWFWKQAFQNIAGEQLVTQLFPYVSLNIKIKVVHQLSLHLNDSQKADELFEAIKARYGVYLASKLLASCSSGVIMNCIQSNRIKPSPKQLLMIIKRNPEIIEDILKALKSDDVNVGKIYKNVFIHLAKRDILLFAKLHEEYGLSIRLGWRATESVVETNRQEVIKSPSLYYKLLHGKQIAKSLGQDFKKCYFNLFPKNIDNFYYDVRKQLFSIATQLPKRLGNVHLYLTTFEEVYGEQLWERSSYVTRDIMKMLTPDERELVFAKFEIDCFREDEQCCYWKTQKSIPFLKKKISLTSDIGTRATLIKSLIKTCALNADKAALAGICKYMITKHRNDSIAVRLAFLKALKEKFSLENLEEQHWTHINEIIQLFALNNETFYDANDFLESYIYYRFNKKFPVKEQVIEWVKLKPYRLNMITEKPEYEKQCLLIIGENIPQVFTGEDFKSMMVRFSLALVNWNERHPEDEFCLYMYTRAIECLKQLLSEARYDRDVALLIKYLIKQSNGEERTHWLNICLKHSRYAGREVMIYVILHEPLFVIQHVETVTQIILKVKTPTFFWKFCKKYSPTGIPQEVVRVILNIYQKEEEDLEIVENAIAALSYLMPAEEFLMFATPYYPSNLQADTKSKEGGKIRKTQQKIAFCLRNINLPSLCLSNIMSFCKGVSTIRPILGSLYSLCSDINEDKLVPFTTELAGRPVLIRKHALHFTFRFLDEEHKYSILHQFMETEKKPSVRQIIFKIVLNSFLKNPNDYSWELVKLTVKGMDINDTKIFDKLFEINKIPLQYMQPYVVFTWHIVNSVVPDESVDSKKAKILNALTTEIIQLLPKEFCNTVVKSCLFKYNNVDTFHAAVQSFACKYIIYCNSQTEQEERLKLTFEILKNYIITNWHNIDVRLASRQCTSNFLKIFCLEFLTDMCFNIASLIQFSELWNNFLKPHEAFDEYLHLQFTLIYVEKLHLSESAQKFAVLCDNVTETYGLTVVDMFCNKINSFKGYFIKDADRSNENTYVFIENFIGPESSVARLLLVILLLNSNCPEGPKSEEKYNVIIETLVRNPDPMILLFVNRHFRGVSTLDYH